MKNSKNFPFKKARRITAREIEAFRKAIDQKRGSSKRGRPPKTAQTKFKPVSIRLHPKVIEWAKREGRKRGVGYQTVINEILLKEAA